MEKKKGGGTPVGWGPGCIPGLDGVAGYVRVQGSMRRALWVNGASGLSCVISQSCRL